MDGTGSAPQEADVAIDGDSITAVGAVAQTGKEEIDAAGHAVTPGFIDLHTHLDAQIGWDPHMTSVTWHGVTTALLGNCGVTFAPCRAEDREFLAGMMETVEDIPKHAILTGLPWDWESYGGYLDSIERLQPMINVCGLVGHSATRFHVMGERAIEEQATEDEIREIAALAGASVAQGALGFSVNRHPGHTLPDRRPIPGTFASRAEMLAIAEAVGAQGGLMQTVPNFGKVEDEMDLLAAQGKSSRVLFSAIGEHRQVLDEKVTAMRDAGVDITAVTVPRSGGGVGGLSTSNFWRTPHWNELRRMGFEERLAAIADADFRAKLVADVRDNEQLNEQVLKDHQALLPHGRGCAAELHPAALRKPRRHRRCRQRTSSGDVAALDAGEQGQGAVPPPWLQRQSREPRNAHHHRLGAARPRRRRRPREPDDRFRLGHLRALALAPRQRHLLARGSGAAHCRRTGAGAWPEGSRGCWRRAARPTSTSSTSTAWKSASPTSSTTSRAARSGSSSAPKATGRRSATAA